MTWGGTTRAHLTGGAPPAADTRRADVEPAWGPVDDAAGRARTPNRRRPISISAALILGIATTGTGCVAATVVRASSTAFSSPAPIPVEPAPLPLEDQSSPTVACADLDLPVQVVSRDAALGLRVLVLQVSNCTDVAVIVQGYPALQLRDVDQELLVVATTHGTTGGLPDPGPVAVDLAPGASAWASVSWRSTVTEGTAHTADHLIVDPTPDDVADGEATGRVQVLDETIDIGTTGAIDVTAWQPAP